MKNGSTGRGGRRRGAGRKRLPLSLKRANVTVKLWPDSDDKWAELALKSGVSKGGILEWLVGSPKAAVCRRNAIRHAHKFLRPETEN